MKAQRHNFQVGLILVLCALQFPVSAQAPIWIWATAFTGDGYVQTQEIASSSLNGCFVLGTFSNNLYLPFDTLESLGGPADYFVAHVDTLGTVTWAAQFSDRVVSMHGLENDGVSCLVSFSGTTNVQGQVVNGSPDGISALVAEFDNVGILTDLVMIPGLIMPFTGTATPSMHHAPESGIALIVLVHDSILVSGTVTHGPGRVLARISLDGELIWAQMIDQEVSTLPGEIHMDAVGRTLVCAPLGLFGALSSYAPNGTLEWQTQEVYYEIFDPPVLARRTNGSALLGLGHPAQGGQGGGMMLEVSHYDSTGTPSWYARTSNTDSWYHGINSLDAIADGASLVGGRFAGPLTFGTVLANTQGPNGFVAVIDSLGTWQWVVSETSGNVFGFATCPGTSTRMYAAGWSDGSVMFGDHQVSTNFGNFVGFVACLGDVILNTPDTQRPFIALNVWPNPTTNIVHLSQNFAQEQELRIFDASGRTVSNRVLGSSTSAIDISDLFPGIYLLRIGERQARVVKQ